jgi:hypothetical protein
MGCSRIGCAYVDQGFRPWPLSRGERNMVMKMLKEEFA